MHMEHKISSRHSVKNTSGVLKEQRVFAKVCKGTGASNVRGPRTVQKRMGGILINIRDLAHWGSSRTRDCLERAVQTWRACILRRVRR
jgi:hypothetical protein